MTGRRLSMWFLLCVVSLASLTVLVGVSPSHDQSSNASYQVITPVNHVVVSEPVVTPTPVVSNEVVGSAYARLWFGGDVMLSRQVGEYALKYGSDFPWRGMSGLFSPDDAVFINFEACASPRASFSWDDTFRFPVHPELLPAVASSGVTHVSLANNHGLDCGAADFAYTKEQFRLLGIEPVGHPVTIGEYSVATTTVGQYTVGVLALHTLFSEPDNEELAQLSGLLQAQTDIQVAFLHWGVEYEPEASPAERALARTLSHLGFDVIIGHHPHVVQDIEWVGETLVVYSLGNLIFDQYFSPAVQEGLLVVLEPTPTLQLRLVPVSSAELRTQPRPLTNLSVPFLESLALRSDESLREAISAGTIPLSRNLASSSKPGMIAP